MRNTFRTGRPMKFKLGISLQMEHEDSYQAPCPPRSKFKITRSRDAYDMCWPISQEQKVPETPKLVGSLPKSRAIMRTSSKVKDQGHQAV